jgi:predicted lipoprotein with Yx(FWY)xxD motif
MSARQADARPARVRRRRGIGAAASLVVVAAVASACSSNVGGSEAAAARPGNAKGKGIITGAPGATFPPSFSSSSPAPSSSSPPGSTSRAGRTISAASVGRLGRVLRDGSGRPVYLFTKDRDQHSTCYGSCAKVWLPVTTGGRPHATGRAKSSLLGTTTRHDGQKQVTYAGHPLYYHGSAEHQSTGAKGGGQSQFGGTWYAVSPRGTAVRKPGP